jgi:UDP-N-acetylglucosamine 2-epimerase (non-hydrolysing)/GDP/UDP-N,N'-diacetylbacillosamine 2-epimerase (hydrolysing)
VFVNLDPITYWSLMGQVDAMVGNSSSGIMEAASFALPVVNVGMRQQGRERAANILDAPADVPAIQSALRRALSSDFRNSIRGMDNPYGKGSAAHTIANVLATVKLEALLVKAPSPVTAPILEVPA